MRSWNARRSALSLSLPVLVIVLLSSSFADGLLTPPQRSVASTTYAGPASVSRSGASRSVWRGSYRRQAAAATTALSATTSRLLEAGSAMTSTAVDSNKRGEMGKIKAAIVKAGMMLYIASMCIALPIALFPIYLIHRIGLVSRTKKEHMALRAGQFCSRWLVRLIPFANIRVVRNDVDDDHDPEPAIWVCNHTSMLDVFILLAADKKLRGRRRRPIKIVYWKGLEANPITRLLFTMCGMIPVEMADNGNGNPNDYDRGSFRSLLKLTKQAFEEGFDIGLLPEGQLNPHPESGLLPLFPGAQTLAKMSRRPIRMMALSGVHRLWHPREDVGMTVTGRDVSVRAYPGGRAYESGEEFMETFRAVVGPFGARGIDLPRDELDGWLDGREWKRRETERLEKERKKKEEEALKAEATEAAEPELAKEELKA